MLWGIFKGSKWSVPRGTLPHSLVEVILLNPYNLKSCYLTYKKHGLCPIEEHSPESHETILSNLPPPPQRRQAKACHRRHKDPSHSREDTHKGKTDQGSSPTHGNGYPGFGQNMPTRLHFIQNFLMDSYILQAAAGQGDPMLGSALATGRMHWKSAVNTPSASIFNAENQSPAVYCISRARG